MYPDSAGAGVDVWVVDTGLFAAHAEFGGRATLVKSFVDGETTPDGNGHGSHCSGTIGSHTYGVAKKATLKGVKVLNSGGSGTWSAVISGVDFVAKNVRKGKTVMSMSLGGGKNQALNDAMNNAVKAGVVAIVAAGNNAGDACQISPASAEHAFAVGATDNADNMASFSNRGKCVKIFAPGVNVMSVWNTAGSTKTISGTSMATPHVAGVAASLMSRKDYNSPQEVYAALASLGTKNVVKGLPAGTVNLMLYNDMSNGEDRDFVGTEPTPAEPKPETPKPTAVTSA
jgi:subtilisin family serine protease